MERKKWLIPVLLVGLLSNIATSLELSEHLAQTKNGPLQGVIKESRSGSKYIAFLGVRYTNPPARFEAAEPLTEKWETPKKADKLGSICAQHSERGFPFGTAMEAKNDKNVASLPVIVWIHGGGFLVGDGNDYRAEYFMESDDVILVTVNYRLGIFGFLSFEDDVVASNNALRDQSMALRWVKENISGFKGDRKKVTLAGHSAGSASVYYHLMSKVSKGLFQRAILMSGGITFWAYDFKPRETALKIGAHLGCEINSELDPREVSLNVRKCLESKTTSELILAQATFAPRWPAGNIVSRFLPTSVEAKNSKVKPFFSNHPESIYLKGGVQKYVNDVPVLAGVTKDEGSTLFAPFVLDDEKAMKEMNENWNDVAPKAFCYETFFPTEDLPVISERIRNFYFGSKSISFETRQQLADVYSDTYFLVPLFLAADNIARSGLPVYPYLFTYQGDFSLRNALGKKDLPGMVGHADELQFMFQHALVGPPIASGSDHEAFSKRFIKYLISFAANGKPSSEWTPGNVVNLEQIPGKNQSKQKSRFDFKLLQFDKDAQIVPIDFNDRVEFWVNLLQEHAVKPRSVGKKVKTEL